MSLEITGNENMRKTKERNFEKEEQQVDGRETFIRTVMRIGIME